MARDIELDETEPASGTVDASAKRALKDAPTDKLSRAVAKSKIAAALFAKREPVKLGRYHLLEQVGAGGMGVVWGAWDPELDRRVAIKVVKPELAAARDRIVSEGQALAKLSNPHVVPVYDVGVVDEQVYLVMEWVRGETLRAWAEQPREIKDIVFAYRDAAHDAGLVHRDFKPDNAMLGTDGRVRVLDFGLAHGGGAAGGIAGTPRYMAPEQKLPDATLTAAVDQYAVGIALKETLPSPPPKWLAAIIAQATAAAPADRFPSMHALVAALANDPARIRRRRIAIAGALGLAGATFAIGIAAAGDEGEERCIGGPAEIATAWSPSAAQAMRTHLVALGPYGAQLAELAGKELDGYATRWVTTQKAACRANDRGELTPVLYTSQLACLTRAKVSLATAREVLATSKLERLPDAVKAMGALPAVERCRTDTSVPPPAAIAERVAMIDNDIARARVLAFAVDPDAIGISTQAANAARRVAYPRQVGHALLVLGLAYVFQHKYTEASIAFKQGADASLEAEDNPVAIEAIARRIFAEARSDQPDASITSALELATPIAKGLPAEGAFARTLYYNNLGVHMIARGDRKAARRWLREAERVRPPASRDNYELATIAGNLGLLEPDRAARDAYFEREGREAEAALGPDHPFTIDARMKRAMHVENPVQALALIREQLARYRTMHAHLSDAIGHTAYQVVWLAEELGEMPVALEVLASVEFPEGLEPIAGAYRALLAGDNATALREMTAVAAELAADEAAWRRARSVDANLIASLAAARLGDRARAIQHAETALATITSLGATSTSLQRRRGRLLAMLVSLGAGDVAARRADALAWARLAGGYDARIADLTGR